MKLLILSDLHLEFDESLPRNHPQRFHIPEETLNSVDVLVLAGDIHTGKQALLYIEKWLDINKSLQIVYIAGNHEYYGKDLLTLDKEMIKSVNKRNETNGNRIHYLQYGDAVEIADVLFCGGTLWTDFNRGNPNLINVALNSMNDFRVIKNMNPLRWMSIHQQTLSEIKFTLEAKKENQKCVVVTHHAPHIESIEAQYKGSDLNSAYYTELFDFIMNHQPDVWIHGHMHSTSDYWVGETRVICNPRGYVGHHLNPDFEMKIIEL